MTLKINILLVLSLLFFTSISFSEDKFLRIKGTAIDRESTEEISDFNIEIIHEDGKVENISSKKSSFDFYLRDNRIFKLSFVKKGYQSVLISVNTLHMPSVAYSKKQKVELKVKLKKVEHLSENKKVQMSVDYVRKLNQFKVKDMLAKKKYKVSADYTAPFASPADTYKQVKPTVKSLLLTTQYNTKKAIGENGIAKAVQGILFADLNYCFFNERTNDANKILEKLKACDPEVWKSINPVDSPEYGVIIARTLNREQSVDTIFALGAYVETSRLILQSFTSDSKVLVHLKKLPKVLGQFKNGGDSQEEKDFILSMNQLIEPIRTLEETYKDLLKKRMNFEMSEDPNFIEIKKRMDEIYSKLIL